MPPSRWLPMILCWLLASPSLIGAQATRETATYKRIKASLDAVPAIDTHDHLWPFDKLPGYVETEHGKGMNLTGLWHNSYYRWTHPLTPERAGTISPAQGTTRKGKSKLTLPASAMVVCSDAKIYPPYTRPTLIAHRGASADAPEHTLAAYELALKHGADFVEPDLQMTRDGVLVCLHDTSLERTTDVAKVFPDRAREVKGKKTWPVAEFTLAEIQKLDAGSWKAPRFAGARVPTFQQMIDTVKGKAGIIPETKALEEYGKRGLNMEKALMEVLKANNLATPGADPQTPVVIQSFSADSLKALRKEQGCKLPLVHLMDKGDVSAERLKQIKVFAEGISPSKALVLAHPELVKDAHALGLSVTVWTFRAGNNGKFKDVREEMAYFLRDLGVDAVFTDNPERFPRE